MLLGKWRKGVHGFDYSLDGTLHDKGITNGFIIGKLGDEVILFAMRER
jgi:hypothetical protein